MSRFPRRLQPLLFILLGLAILPAADAGNYRVVGYTAGWQPVQARHLGQIDVVNFAFAKLDAGRVTLDNPGRRALRRLVALKQAHPRLQVVISVGGWGAGGFSEAAATREGRQRFADSAAALVAQTGADGLDVDWEYPGHAEAGIVASPDDRANFTLLLAAVRASLDQIDAGRGDARHRLLTIAIADGMLVDGTDIAAIEPLLDWFNLMTYDFVNAMTPTTGHHSGLHAAAMAPGDARSASRAVRQFRAAGVPAHKLIVGVAFYGREFSGVAPAYNGRYQPFTAFAGMHAWPALKAAYINRAGYVRYWDETAQAPWLWNATTRHFISYDDPASIAAKAAWVRQQGLGGLMYWEQGLDPDGELLKAVRDGLDAAPGQ